MGFPIVMGSRYVLIREASKPLYAVVPREGSDPDSLELLLHSAVLLMQGKDVPLSPIDVVRKANPCYQPVFPRDNLGKLYPGKINLWPRYFRPMCMEINLKPSGDGVGDPGLVRILSSRNGNLLICLNGLSKSSPKGNVPVGAQDNLQGLFKGYWVHSPGGGLRVREDEARFRPLSFVELTDFISANANPFLRYVLAGQTNFQKTDLSKWEFTFSERVNPGYHYYCNAEIGKGPDSLVVDSLKFGLEPLTEGAAVVNGSFNSSVALPLHRLPLGVGRFRVWSPEIYHQFFSHAKSSLQFEVR